MTNTILTDKTPIQYAWLNDEHCWKVGANATSISPYKEKGEYDFITMLVIYNCGEIIARVPAVKCLIKY